MHADKNDYIHMCIHKKRWSLSNPGSSLSLQIIEVSAFQGVGLEQVLCIIVNLQYTLISREF